MTGRRHDCILCGSCVADVVCRPVELDRPLGAGALHRTDPIRLVGGGITINAGITLARLGARVSLLSYVGDDQWGAMLRRIVRSEGIGDELLRTHPTEATSTSVVVVDQAGNRSFLHGVGAPRRIDRAMLLEHADAFARTGAMLLGYFSLMPELEPDLAEVLATIRRGGCLTALDAAGSGGSLESLSKVLPHLDVYVPSHAEARQQTGREEPRAIVRAYREGGGRGLLGVKLGADGVLLSPTDGRFVTVDPVTPPGPVLDTTGAGDCFYGGLLAGLLRGLSTDDAGRLGAAAAACSVTALGGATGTRGYAETARLAGLQAGTKARRHESPERN